MSILGEREIEFAKLRLIDFYFVFPHLLADIKLPQLENAGRLKKLSKALPTPYEKLPDKKRIFSEMGDFQIQAAHILKAKKILNMSDELRVRKGDNFTNDSISKLAIENSYLSNQFYSFLVEIFYHAELSGEAGLKKRTELMEYRYDAI